MSDPVDLRPVYVLVQRLDRVLADGQGADDGVAFLEFIRGRFQDTGDGETGDGFSEFEGRAVGLDVRGAHAAAHIGVERRMDMFEQEGVGGEGGGEVDRVVFDRDVFTRLGPMRRNLFED